MNAPFLERFLHFLAGVGWVMGLVWIGLLLFSVGLVVLMYTRWGQSHPLEKCLGLSLLAHGLLMGYATTISISAPPLPPLSSEPVFQIAVAEGDAEQDSSSGPAASNGLLEGASDQPWEVLQHESVAQPEPATLERQVTDSPPPERTVQSEVETLPGETALDNTAISHTAVPEPKVMSLDEPLAPDTPVESVAPPLETPTAQSRDSADAALVASLPQSFSLKSYTAPSSVLEPTKSATGDMPRELMQPSMSAPRLGSSGLPDAAGSLAKASLSNAGGGSSSPADARTEIPEMYKLRVLPNRSGVTQTHGGSTETEKAVQAALKWLAENQADDGCWKAGDHGAGRDENVLGHQRPNAGSQADTGVTGLALLAFLAAGHTHEQGEHKDATRKAIEFLLRTQARNGSLGGSASTYEFMYCHAMATCALSEAYGMTRDKRLREPVERAIRYSVSAQDPKGGGWRYHPRDPGDTSQLGWQLMALKSAELAGIPLPPNTRSGIIRFLQNVSSGKHGGLASYRPGEKISHSMTAEALVCWQFLGLSRDHPACNEAGDYLLTQLPGQGVKPDDYYWYYGTLAMYQLQGDYWQKWNAALRKTVLARQIKEGPLAGAWETDTVWGGYGGRIYTTAIATLSLEVYYRFLPLYSDTK